ncbi:hypothetical protein SAMN04515656_10991 [Eubacterium aggregans]|uniref:SipW-cognate class signal peptide n=1 Tax=Eubacterium aggregans TaxID=81409 RepID=A0A1H4AY23_9FIRM|nr:hypothetical protein [Eubacterium aggregans]SEA40734.1 hypothetical protein SAMN04515656_10991 [Eubacterium aggregans]
MKNTKKKIAITIAIVTVLALFAGTYAAFFTSTKTTKEVSTANLGIEIVQTGDMAKSGVTEITDAKKGSGFQYAGVPGDVVDERVAVQATGSKDAYVRVTINRSWIGIDGKKALEVDPSEIGIVCKNGDWIIKEDAEDPEVVECYYKKVLPSGAISANVMDAFSILADKVGENSNNYLGLSTQITFKADGIQTVAAKDAMLSEWGIVAEIDDNGQITAVAEQ